MASNDLNQVARHLDQTTQIVEKIGHSDDPAKKAELRNELQISVGKAQNAINNLKGGTKSIQAQQIDRKEQSNLDQSINKLQKALQEQGTMTLAALFGAENLRTFNAHLQDLSNFLKRGERVEKSGETDTSH